MLQERLKIGVIEPCHGPYRNPWYLVKKSTPGKYRLVNVVVELNQVTVRDANLPPSVDEFSEKFAGCAISTLIDFFSGYDQVELDEESRDLTGFMTPLGLMRMTALFQELPTRLRSLLELLLRFWVIIYAIEPSPSWTMLVLRGLRLHTITKNLLQESGAMWLSTFKT